jgi:hypothetical protein
MNLRHLTSLGSFGGCGGGLDGSGLDDIFVGSLEDIVERPGREVHSSDLETVWDYADPVILSDFLSSLGLDTSFSFFDWATLPAEVREELVEAKRQYEYIKDSVTLTKNSTDEEQLEAYADLLGYLQPIYYPMYDGELEDLVQDFWLFMNTPESYSEVVKDLRNVPAAVKSYAINWLSNQNRSKHFNHELDARLREEVNRSSGNIDLADYLDEAYARIFSFSEKQLVSFIRKFKELMKTDKRDGYALTPEQIDLFKPLFEKAQFLLKEARTSDSVDYDDFVFDSDSVVPLTEPLKDLLGTIFDID